MRRLCYFLLTIMCFELYAGDGASNGGNGLLCTGSNGEEYVIPLDLAEVIAAKNFNLIANAITLGQHGELQKLMDSYIPLNYSLISDFRFNTPVVLSFLEYLEKTNHKRYIEVLGIYHELIGYKVYETIEIKETIMDLKSDLITLLEKYTNCSSFNIIEANDIEKSFTINVHLFERQNLESIKILILHELLYRYSRKICQIDNSLKSRWLSVKLMNSYKNNFFNFNSEKFFLNMCTVH